MAAQRRLFRNPAAVVLKAGGSLRILLPPDVLLTLEPEDAEAAERLLVQASVAPIPAPAPDTDEGRLAIALEEEGVLLGAPAELSKAETGAAPVRPIRVLYGITGAIDAVRAPVYLSALQREGDFELRVALTDAAGRFVLPQALRWYSGAPVADGLFDGETAEQVVLGRWADVVVVLPAAAEFLCRLAAGGYSDLLSATIAASTGIVVLAPSMGEQMWNRRAVQRAIRSLTEEGFEIVLPGSGWEVAEPSAGPGFGGVGVGPDELPGLIRLLAARSKG